MITDCNFWGMQRKIVAHKATEGNYLIMIETGFMINCKLFQSVFKLSSFAHFSPPLVSLLSLV